MKGASLRSRTAGRGGLVENNRGYIEDYGDDDSTKSSQKRFSLSGIRNNFTTNVLAGVAITTCILNIEFNDSYVVMTASILTILCSCLLVYQQRALRRLISLRHQHNEIRRKLFFFQQERERLHRTLDRLDESAAELHSIPQELHQLSKTTDVNRLVSLIKQQKIVQDQMRQRINQQVIQNILSIVLQSDRDGSWSLKQTEVERLALRLGMVEEIEFNEQQFRKVIGPSPNLGSVIKVIRSLVERDDEYEHDDPVFKVRVGSQKVFTV